MLWRRDFAPRAEPEHAAFICPSISSPTLKGLLKAHLLAVTANRRKGEHNEPIVPVYREDLSQMIQVNLNIFDLLILANGRHLFLGYSKATRRCGQCHPHRGFDDSFLFSSKRGAASLESDPHV